MRKREQLKRQGIKTEVEQKETSKGENRKQWLIVCKSIQIFDPNRTPLEVTRSYPFDMDSPALCVSPTSQFKLVLVHRISTSLATTEENESILSHY